jgi:AcrR family transcriptional regulator
VTSTTQAAELSPYERGRVEGDRALRTSLLDVAGDLLAHHGSGALTMRRLAETYGCSTTVLYRLFGGKQRIVEALYREGFERLRLRMAAVAHHDDALAHLAALAHAYREHALAEPTYYAVMFSRAVPEFEPDEQDLQHARRSNQILLDAVATAQHDGRLGGPSPEHVAHVLWSAAHGAVSLELAGYLEGPEAAAVFDDLITAAAARFAPTHD